MRLYHIIRVVLLFTCFCLCVGSHVLKATRLPCMSWSPVMGFPRRRCTWPCSCTVLTCTTHKVTACAPSSWFEDTCELFHVENLKQTIAMNLKVWKESIEMRFRLVSDASTFALLLLHNCEGRAWHTRQGLDYLLCLGSAYVTQWQLITTLWPSLAETHRIISYRGNMNEHENVLI